MIGYNVERPTESSPAILDLTTGTLISETDGVIGRGQLPPKPEE